MRLAAFFLALLAAAPSAAADPVHRVHFAVAPIIHVWGDASTTVAPPLTGALLSARDTPGRAAFQVATNTPFEICVSSVDGRSIASKSVAIALTGAAPNAQSEGGPVVRSSGGTLCLWQATARTALKRGSPGSQALSFLATWDAEDSGTLSILVRPLHEEHADG